MPARSSAPRFTAEDLAVTLDRTLADAFAIEGQPIEVELIGPRRIRLRAGGERFDLTVVRKR